ncbi:MAG: J domain-containing protein [Polyangia bacterium]
MTVSTCIDNLQGACRVLFGPQVALTPGFLDSLQPAMVKHCYRKRALEVHPDRARAAGRNQHDMTELFKDVQMAYRLLAGYVATRGRPQPQPAIRKRAAPAPCTAPSRLDHVWPGPIPRRRLRLGEYLYCSRRISWMGLIKAIVWQNRQRPRFGQLATRLGHLTTDLVNRALDARQPGEKIGDAALRLDLLTLLQRESILRAQACRQRRLGQYFVETGVLQPAELAEILQRLRRHNASVG